MDKKVSADAKSQTRPPIVVVLGHVDHGKTTLLDYIRQTNIAQKEAGGITQKIGASVVTTKEGKKITFIDTPGHAAFAKIRSRGAKVADIAVLVVAADDGVKPQTKEALTYILAADIPYVVAATKVDLPSASTEALRTQLEEQGVKFEGGGGDIPLVSVSAREGLGVEELLETIILVSEVHGIKGDSEGALEAVVIETGKDNRGITASIVVREGTLSVGDEIAAGTQKDKVRGIFDSNEKSVESVGPGQPALVLGFSEAPDVGSRIWKLDEKTTMANVEEGKKITKVKVEEGQVPIVLKAKNAGGLEAISGNLPKEIAVIFSGVGDVSEGDVFLAKSSNAKIIAFESKISNSVKKLADTEGTDIQSFSIIYKLFESLDELIKKDQLETLGKAEVIASFPYEKKLVAGCRIMTGKISKTDSLLLVRDEKEMGKIKIISIKKGKDSVDLVKQGEECGILFTPQLDFEIGDVILSVSKNPKS